jgi:hypothetical protein
VNDEATKCAVCFSEVLGARDESRHRHRQADFDALVDARFRTVREGPASPNADTAGGKIAKLAQDAFLGGRKGYFADPDGHLREVSWNTQSPRALSATSSAFSASTLQPPSFSPRRTAVSETRLPATRGLSQTPNSSRLSTIPPLSRHTVPAQCGSHAMGACRL